MKRPGSAQHPDWYKDAIIYETHVKAFFDSSNDGVGDFQGLTQKLDYVQALGVTCLWLLPFFPSPLRDDGYDIADYTNVHPSYGTLDDFKTFLAEAHRRGLQVIIELVVNHTSDQHPWFQAARHAPPESPARDFYVWSDTDQKYQGTRIIFTDTEKSNWAWDTTANAYYWHRFFSHQPDLNFDNPAVVAKVIEAMRFWLDLGVDGMRLDATPYLVERDGTTCENLPETHAVIRQIRAALDAEYENRMFLAEANQWPADVRPYFGDADECHMAFHFPLMPRMFMALRLEDRYPITEIMAQTPPIPDACQWALFLRNHDEMTLEMVTDEERDYMYHAYSADPKARINVGIRRRLAPLMDNNMRRIELMKSMLLSFPGTPIIYYGDEIGMGDNIYLGDRNGVRTPMQWTPDRNAGFSRSNPARLYSPPVMDAVYGYEAVNVEAQQSDPSSLLSWMQHMIALRKLHPVFGRGGIEFLTPANRKVLAYLREHGSDRILCVANLSRFAQAVELDLGRFAGLVPVEMLGNTSFPRIGELPYLLTLAPYGFYWFEIRTAPDVEAEPLRLDEDALHLPADGVWDRFLDGLNRVLLERKALPAFLPTQRWFGARMRSIARVRIADQGLLLTTPTPAWLLILDVTFTDGGDERYVLPVTVAAGPEAAEIRDRHPRLVVARTTGHLESGVLYDATGDDSTCHALLSLVQHRRPVSMRHGTVHPVRTKAFGRIRGRSRRPLTVRLGHAEQSNTSIIFGERLILKLFRRLQAGPSPDVEVSRFLTERARFPHVPPVAGSFDYAPGQGEPAGLGLLQGLVSNQGDGWRWAVDELERYLERVVPIGPAPLTPETPLIALCDEAPPPETADAIGPALDSAATLGRRTADLHLALAAPSEDPAFAPEPLDAQQRAAIADSMRTHAAGVLDELQARVGILPLELTDDAWRLVNARTSLLDRFERLVTTPIETVKTRIHGDYHLGQVLVVGQDFAMIDFEGEPVRSLDERRAKYPPVKDVAGMLRSYSYAAHAGLFAYAERQPDDAGWAAGWTRLWERWMSAAFLGTYRRTVAGAPVLPGPAEHAGLLLELYLLDKACYELRYELNHRPGWVRIPLAGLLAFV